MPFVARRHARVVLSWCVLLGTPLLLLARSGLGAEERKFLLRIEAKAKGGSDFMMKATEVERGEKTSTVKVIRNKKTNQLDSLGSRMFVVRAFYEIAKARKCEYFANLKEWDDEDGSRMYVAGFTNEKDVDIKKEFGDQFDSQNESGEKRKLLSVSQLGPLFAKGVTFPVTVQKIPAPAGRAKTSPPASGASK